MLFTFKCGPQLPKVGWRFYEVTSYQSTKKANISPNSRLERPPLSPLPCSPSHTALHRPFISPYISVHVRMNLKCEWLLQQRGKADGGDQPAHVERHGCSLMWLQLGSPGPNEVLWSPASAPAPIAYTPVAHIRPRLHHSGSLRGLLLHSSGDPESKDLKIK